MALEELKKLDDATLKEKEAELRRQVFDLRTQQNQEKPKPNVVREAKKDIARIKTLLTQREQAKK